MTKTTIAPKDPFATKRLTQDQKRKIMNLAAERFMEHELRKKERKAAEAIVKAIAADATSSQVSNDIEVLNNYQRVQTIHKIKLADARNIKIGTKTFTRPDGVDVSRDDMVQVYLRKGFDGSLHFASLRDDGYDYNGLLTCMILGKSVLNERKLLLELGGEFIVPGIAETEWNGFQNVPNGVLNLGDVRDNAIIWRSWISAKTWKAVDAFYLANKTRFDAELDTLRTLWKVVDGSANYGALKAFWPEVEELEGDLFGVAPIRTQALTVLNQEDVAKLCNKMSARGIHSEACMVASSPANAEVLAAAE
jgi:hypothetical protein